MSFTVYFVQDTTTDLLKQAHDSIKAIDQVKLIWIEEKKLLKTQNFGKNPMFVLGYFECSSLKYLESLKLPIFGPQCLLAYFGKDDVLPKSPYPLFSIALKDIHVCFSSIEEENKIDLTNKVKMMHGFVSDALKANVQILISSSVQSRKYRVASEKGIPVVRKEWVEELWTLSKNCVQLNGVDQILIDKYQIPILHNLKICLSGFNESERDEAKQMVIENGGSFYPNLNVNDCTHLIAKNASGQKFSYAKKWNITTVTCEWLIESIKKGYACDVAQYQLSDEIHVPGSTPKKDSKIIMDSKCNEISVIFDGSHADETRLDNHDESDCVPDSRIWIDCHFQLLDYKEEFVTKWENLIKENGGKIVSSVTMPSTHIIVDDCTKLTEKTDGILYLKSDWLQACLNENRLVNVHQYIVDIYRPAANVQSDNWGSMNELDWGDTMKTVEVNNNKDESTVIEKSTMSIDAIPNGIFYKFIFHMDNETCEKSIRIVNSITENAGTVISTTEGSTHYILPNIFSTPIKSISSSTRVVTVYYIEQCLEQNQILPLDSDFLFNPISIDSNHYNTILVGTVISFSGYPAEERQLLKETCTKLGATVQDQMSRKKIPSKRILATTHLIISKPDNKKFPSSKSWGIPAVTKHWIGECINRLKRVDPGNYLLQSDDSNISVATTTSDQSNFNEICMSIDHPISGNKPESILPAIEESGPVTDCDQSKSSIKNQCSTPVRNKALDIDWKHSDMESPIYREDPNKPRPKLIYDENMFKTPEQWKKYRKPISPINTPEMRNGLARRIARMELDYKDKPYNKYLDETLSDTYDPTAPKPLTGVVIYIFGSFQAEYLKLMRIVKNLGGPRVWAYDSKTVTRVVCIPMAKNSYLSDENRDEILKFDEDSKVLVTSDWLLACEREQRHVEEVKYLVNIDQLLGLKSKPKKRKPSESLSNLTDRDEQPEPKKRLSLESHCENNDKVQWDYEQKSISKHELSGSFSPASEITQLDIEKVFMFSNIAKTLEQHYDEEIRNLGGSLELNSDFSMRMTHLICGEPCLNEKYLAAIAAGKWVLHKSYLDESISQGKWLEETEFQWGGSRKNEFLQLNPTKTYGKIFLALLDASKHWHEIGGGAFKEWRVCLIEKNEKYEKMCKIIEAGGGTVVPFSEPISQLGVTHFLVNKSQCSGLPDLSQYPCYKIEMIPSFLSAQNDREIKRCNKKFIISAAEMQKFRK